MRVTPTRKILGQADKHQRLVEMSQVTKLLNVIKNILADLIDHRLNGRSGRLASSLPPLFEISRMA